MKSIHLRTTYNGTLPMQEMFQVVGRLNEAPWRDMPRHSWLAMPFSSYRTGELTWTVHGEIEPIEAFHARRKIFALLEGKEIFLEPSEMYGEGDFSIFDGWEECEPDEKTRDDALSQALLR